MPLSSSSLTTSLLPKAPSPPAFEKFPTLEELAETARTVDTPKPRPKGLFWELFGGRPDALLADVLEHPEHYESRLVALAQELLEGRRKVTDLTSEEQGLLNLGTVNFAQYRPPKLEKPKAPAPPVPRPRRASAEPPSVPEPGVDIPETPGGVRPYWWV